jgi:hypothetical protein
MKEMRDKYKDTFEVLQHVASYPAGRIVVTKGMLSFLLPEQTKFDIDYLAERGCVADTHGTYTIVVGVNTNCQYTKWINGEAPYSDFNT